MGIELQLADDDDGVFLEEVGEKFTEDDKRLLQVLRKWLRSPQLDISWAVLLRSVQILGLDDASKKIASK